MGSVEKTALRECMQALEAIVKWQMPKTGRFSCGGYDGQHVGTCDPASCFEYSYSAEYGSNGERDHIRSLAKKALGSARLLTEDA